MYIHWLVDVYVYTHDVYTDTRVHTRIRTFIRVESVYGPIILNRAFATGRSRRPLNLATRPTLSGAFHRAPLLWDTVRPDPSFRAYPGRESHAFGRRRGFPLSLSCARRKRTRGQKDASWKREENERRGNKRKRLSGVVRERAHGARAHGATWGLAHRGGGVGWNGRGWGQGRR